MQFTIAMTYNCNHAIMIVFEANDTPLHTYIFSINCAYDGSSL